MNVRVVTRVFLAFLALILATGIVVFSIFHIVPPAARITVTHAAEGGFAFHVSPNFVVNSIYGIKIVGPEGLVAEWATPVSGQQELVVSSGLVSGMSVSVECDLQYDWVIAPSITTQRTILVLP